jgi:hypothetical protein
MKILIFLPVLFLMSCGGNSPQDLNATDPVQTIQADSTIQVIPSEPVALHEPDSLFLISDFKNDKLVFGYTDREGNIMIKPQFDYAGDFYKGVAPVIKGNKHGLCDTTGTMIYIFKDYEHLLYPNEPAGIYEFAGIAEGMFLVTDETEKYGCVNTKNELIIPIIYEEIRYFSEGLAPFLKDEKYGYFNTKGEIVIQPSYQHAQDFHEGIAAVGMNDLTGFIDQSGTLIIKPKYSYTSYFSEGLCAVSTNPDWGDFFFIDQSGNTIIKGPFEEAGTFKNGEAYVQKRGVCRIIDRTGKELKKLDWDCFAAC